MDYTRAAMNLRIEPVTADDYRHFVQLVPELNTNDPIPPQEQWAREIAPTTFFVREGDAVAGYAYFQVLQGAGYVRHVVVAPDYRGKRIGHRLMAELAERFRAAGCREWCLNVKPDNTPAVRLYEAVGMRRAYDSTAIRIAWTDVENLPAPEGGIRALRVEPEHDRAIEAAFGLPSGEVQEWRRSSARILLWLTDETGAPLGYASFNPGFPGAFPFRLARVALARNLIEAIRPHAPAGVPHVQFVVEDMPELAKLLCDAGGKVRMVFCHYRGELPPAR